MSMLALSSSPLQTNPKSFFFPPRGRRRGESERFAFTFGEGGEDGSTTVQDAAFVSEFYELCIRRGFPSQLAPEFNFDE